MESSSERIILQIMHSITMSTCLGLADMQYVWKARAADLPALKMALSYGLCHPGQSCEEEMNSRQVDWTGILMRGTSVNQDNFPQQWHAIV